MKTFRAALIAAGLLASTAFAQTPAGPAPADKPGKAEKRAAQMQEHLKAADKNGDGKISLDEAKASLPMIARNFDKIDADKDGFITREELKAWHDRRDERKAPAK
ncbi:MAG TPA: EF-hand domain-containing protein [Usitatibacteraceae bacterium]